MIETTLVYIHTADDDNEFIGCGAVVDGPFIVTCRHVWENAKGNQNGKVSISFLRSLDDQGEPIRMTAIMANNCDAAVPVPDLAILSLDELLPRDVVPAGLSFAERFETGQGFVYGYIPESGDVAKASGSVSAETFGYGWRLFSGDKEQNYWTDEGSSGSPVFKNDGQQLAGILTLSETGKNAKHEAAVIPGTLIRRYLEGMSRPGHTSIVWPVVSAKIETENVNIVGRDKDAEKLADLFEGHSIVAIHAQGGVGKTALADEFARRQVALGRCQGVWRIAATSASDAANDFRPLAAKLGVEASNQPDALISAVLDAMVASGKKWLLVHDNVDDDEMQRGLINRLVKRDNIDHLITGRLADWHDIAEPYSLDELGQKEAVKLLVRESKRKKSRELAELATSILGCLPLALVVAGADLRKMTALSIADYAEQFKQRLNTAPAGKVYEKSVYAAVTGSLANLDESAQALLKLAAFMDPEDIDEGFLVIGAALAEHREYGLLPEPLNTLAKDDLARAAAFAQCRDHSLLKQAQWEDEKTHRIHRLTQLVLRDWMGDEAADYVGYVGRLGDVQFTSSPQFAVEDWPRYRRLAPHARAMAVEAARAVGDDLKRAASFVNQTALYLDLATGDLPLVKALYQDNLAIQEAAFGKESRNYSAALGNLGEVQGHLGEDEEAEENLKQALEISILVTEEGDPSRAYKHNNLAFFYNARKRFAEAEPEFEQALQIWEKAYQEKGERVASAHGNIGSNYSEWAKAESDAKTIATYREKAMFHLTISLDLVREALGELHFDTASCLQNLAIEYLETGDPQKALPLQTRAAAIPLAMHQQGLIALEHPHVQQFIGTLAQLLHIIDPALDGEAAAKKAMEMAMQEIPAVLEAHRLWKEGQDDEA